MSKKSRSGGTSNPGRFRKGRSGNLGGRPTNSPAPRPSAFDVVMDKTLVKTREGITREKGLEEALQQRTYQDALAGNVMAQREVLKWIAKREAWLKNHAPAESRPVITQLISPDHDNVDAVLLLLGIAAINPRRAEYREDRAQLLLEPWAAQEALRRRRGGQRLTERERVEIRRCTRDADLLRWPRGTYE
jgi:hypothetical protein